MKNVHEEKFLIISSLNICRGLFNKEEYLTNNISEQNCDICSVSEVDIEDFDEKRPFSIEGYITYFPYKKQAQIQKGFFVLSRILLKLNREMI